MMHEYTVEQDGADFYLREGSALIAVITYPSGVKDFDIVAAQRAKEWFLKLMRQWGIQIYM